MNEFASAWLASRDRIIDAVSRTSPETLNTMSTLCPEWRLRDIVAHLVGISQDIAAGNFPKDLDAWAGEQVRRNYDVPLRELIDEWPTLGFENAISSEFAIALYDQVTHECDLFHGLGHAAHVDQATLRLLGDFTLSRFGTGDNGLTVSLHLDGDTLRRGSGERELSLRSDYFSWLRASTGRRSRAQIDAMDWSGDRDAIGVLFTGIFRPAEFDVVESWQP